MPNTHDIIAIGASAGGVEALIKLFSKIDSSLDVTYFVVLHVSATGYSVLPEILSRYGRLKAVHPTNGDPIMRGWAYVAPPDKHLAVSSGRIQVTSDPKVNGFRPSIDTLFQSVATEFKERTIGVVLSGALSDGTAGLISIYDAGGYTIVQDPGEALYPSMPRNAIAHDHVNEVLGTDQIAERINAFASQTTQ